ncbi:MAG: acyl-CoA/acyl-ACP dehydrogenase [Candidatus Rokubacteria bacterium]|nr:acyl-CoA/acyl-ACP dehydrogenase [Candidatus Rokubacteria bacterium]
MGAVFPLPPLTEEQRRIVDRAATLSRERFAARAATYDAESAFPYENYRDLHAAGLLALTVPKAYGGSGADPIAYVHALREIAKGCPATALTFNMHATVTTLIAALGTEAQKRRYFGDIVEGGRLIASITSEPEQSFRDKFVLNTLFRPVPGGYHVAGVKQFCSLGEAADYYFVTGIVEGTTTALEGVISALIPRSDSGIKVEALWNATGMRGTVSHTIRYDSTVDAASVVGRPGEILTIDLSGFALGYAAVYLGIGEAAFDFMVEYAKTRTQKPSTVPMSHHPLVQRTIAEMGTAIRAARLLLHDAARVRMTGDKEATMLAANQSKTYSADVGLMVTERALRLAGGRGILKDLPLERWHRDALAGPVMPPSNDRCLETVGKLLCGLRAATLEFQ